LNRLTREDLENALTDVRAEVCLLEAELRRVTHTLTAADAQDPFEAATAAAASKPLIEARLEELEATTAGLRARLQQLAGANSAP
jgi:hypothetical protein